MVSASDSKARAIEAHSRAASTFAAAYETGDLDPYRNCFSYSRYRLQACLDHALPERGDGLRLLDVGCGTGHYLAAFRLKGFSVAGVDGSAAMLQEAHRRNPETQIEQADVEALPFADATFDVVTCIEVLRYLPRPEPCVREMARVLRPGGFCLVTAVPPLNLNGYWLVNRIASGFPIGNLSRLRQTFLTSRRLRQAFEPAGFSPVFVDGVYWGPVNWVERLAPRALPRTLRAFEGLDRALAGRPLLRDLSNLLLVHGVRG